MPEVFSIVPTANFNLNLFWFYFLSSCWYSLADVGTYLLMETFHRHGGVGSIVSFLHNVAVVLNLFYKFITSWSHFAQFFKISHTVELSCSLKKITILRHWSCCAQFILQIYQTVESLCSIFCTFFRHKHQISW